MMAAVSVPVSAFSRFAGIGPRPGRENSRAGRCEEGMYEIAMTANKKGPGKGDPVKPEPDLPPHPDPARRLPDTTEHKNGYTPKPTLQ